MEEKRISATFVPHHCSCGDALEIARQAFLSLQAEEHRQFAERRQALAQKISRAKKKAHERGRQKGFAAGRQSFTEATQVLSVRYKRLLDELKKRTASAIQSISEEVTAVSLPQASHGLHKRIDRLLQQLPHLDEATISLHPHDTELTTAELLEHLAQMGITLNSDPSLEVGDIAVHLPAGTVYSSWRAHHSELASKMFEHQCQPVFEEAYHASK